MSLLDDVSIVVTPNGYKAGELYAVVPVPTEFDGIRKNNFLTAGTRYKLIIEGNTTSSGFTIGETTISGNEYGSGFGTHYFTAIGTGSIWLRQQTAGTTDITSFSIKEYTSADMDVTRATAGTRVDEDGLVNYAEVVLDTELVTNGDFSNGTTGWNFTDSIGAVGTYFGRDEVCEVNFTNSSTIYAWQSSILTSDKIYKVTLDYYIPSTNTSVDNMVIKLGSTSSTSLSPELDILDTWTSVTLYGTADAGEFNIYRGSGTIGDKIYLDNVSVKEVTRDNVPRIDYTGGGCPHILAEPQRKNEITYSEDFSQSYWTKASPTVEGGFISPDGTENAYKLIENTAENVHAFYNSTFSVNNGDTYTISLFIKYNGRQWFRLWGQFGSTNKEAYFDIENGLLGQKDSGVTSKIEDYGNDWYRISASATSDGTNGRFRGYLALDDGDSFYQGNGTSGAFIWGAQYEQGSYPTSYIPNFGTAAGVTRNQDIFTRDGIGSLINDSEGVLFSEVYFEQTGLTNGLFAISDGTVNNILMVRYSPINKLQIESTGGVNIIESSARSSGTYKIAVKYDSNGVELWVDGNKISETSTQSTMSGINELMLGKSPYGNIVGCKVKQLQVYNTALTDEQLLQLTGESGTDFYESYAEMATALTYTIQ